jgi:hypothetical protein
MENFEMNIASMQEGEEWISRLQQDADNLLLDISNVGHLISDTGLTALRYSYMKTENAINSIKMEIMYFGNQDSE